MLSDGKNRGRNMKINFLNPGCDGEALYVKSWQLAGMLGLTGAFFVFFLACVIISGRLTNECADLGHKQLQLADHNAVLRSDLQMEKLAGIRNDKESSGIMQAACILDKLMIFDGMESIEYDAVKHECLVIGYARRVDDMRSVMKNIKANPEVISVNLCEYSNKKRELLYKEESTQEAIATDILPISYRIKVKVK